MLCLQFKCRGYYKSVALPVLSVCPKTQKYFWNREKCGVDFAYLNHAAWQLKDSVKPINVLSLTNTVIARGLQIGPMRKRVLHFLNIISSLSFLCKLTHLFDSILTSFAVMLQWFLLHHFWMVYFLCLWHNVATFLVLESFISAPPNTLLAFISSSTSHWTVFDSFILILSAIYFLLKVHLP